LIGPSYSRSLPLSFPQGNGSCRHSPLYLIFENDTASCGFCHVHDGIQHELPGKLHFSKQLTTNGNPQQTPLLLAHVQLIEGLKPPQPWQSTKQYRLARGQLDTKPAHEIFPYTSALWELMGYQPPIATPLVKALYGKTETEIAAELKTSQYSVFVSIAKAVRWTLKYVRI
jgi:hypothetical protein